MSSFCFVNPLCYNDARMKKKTMAEILAQVSPETTVIPGGKRHGKGKERAEKPAEVTGPPSEPHVPRRMTDEDYDKAEGDPCPLCGDNALQLFPYGFTGQRKACQKCNDRRIKLLEYRARVVSPRFKR
jgi:hypothetical protein